MLSISTELIVDNACKGYLHRPTNRRTARPLPRYVNKNDALLTFSRRVYLNVLYKIRYIEYIEEYLESLGGDGARS